MTFPNGNFELSGKAAVHSSLLPMFGRPGDEEGLAAVPRRIVKVALVLRSSSCPSSGLISRPGNYPGWVQSIYYVTSFDSARIQDANRCTGSAGSTIPATLARNDQGGQTRSKHTRMPDAPIGKNRFRYNT